MLKQFIIKPENRGKRIDFLKNEKTSDTGSQHRCRRVVRGVQPPSTLHTHTWNASEMLVVPLLNSCPQTDGRTNGRMERRTDKASYRVACPQLKTTAYFCHSNSQIIKKHSSPHQDTSFDNILACAQLRFHVKMPWKR